jgi:succinoglycan biosynthesis protein ExoM
MMSAQSVVEEYAHTAPVSATYDVEPKQNIALARNRAVRNIQGNFVAFIDDDESPTDDWLLRLYLACREYHADGALGPVKPLFGPDAPSWLKRSGLCERPSHESGTILNHLQTRTGNVLFRHSILDGVEFPFPPEKGRTGGEDIEFFRCMIARGCRFVWCSEAPVYEHITPNRYSRRYYLDRELRIGGLTGEMLKKTPSGRWPAVLRSVCAVTLHASHSVLSLTCGQSAYVRYAAKTAYHLGRIFGCLGVVPVRYRRDS